MSIRRTFLMLVAPLFLLLAGVNGALLYFWERAEAERGLDQQAIAAAVTTAAFADASDDLARALSDPVRAAGLRSATAAVTGLRGLYVVSVDGVTQRIAGAASPGGSGALKAPRGPRALPIRTDATGRHLATGLAPIAGGGFVVAQIDAEPLFEEVAELQRLTGALMAAAGAIGLLLAMVIARSIVGELKRNNAMIEAIRTNAPAGEVEGLRIRETRDLAMAVRLMQASVSGRVARGRHELARRDRERNEAASVAAYRESAFPPLSATVAGTAVAARMLGAAPAGSFHALCVAGERAALVLGECGGATPAEALARALSARRFFEGHLLDGKPEDRLDEGRRAFDIGRLDWLAWSDAAPAASRALALLGGDDTGRATAYVRHGTGLAPAEMLDDLATLLQASGPLAVVAPASAESGQR